MFQCVCVCPGVVEVVAKDDHRPRCADLVEVRSGEARDLAHKHADDGGVFVLPGLCVLARCVHHVCGRVLAVEDRNVSKRCECTPEEISPVVHKSRGQKVLYI